MKQIRVCPLCGKIYDEAPAVSRQKDVGDICPECGMKEALADWQRELERRENKTVI